MTITATVAMPLYNMGKIAELALEGLCNQKTQWNWELIVCEEQNEQMLGHERLLQYEERLQKAGCEHISYQFIYGWVPLGHKWHLMSMFASDTICFILQAGDCYPHSQRIEETVNSFILNTCIYYDEAQGYFYSFKHKKTVLFNPDSNYHHPCRLNMAWDTSLFKLLPDNQVKRSVDKYIYATLRRHWGMKHHRNPVLHPDGVDTDGYNLISKREKLLTKPNNIFKPTDVDITENLPILKKFEL